MNTILHKGYKFKIKPTQEQKEFFLKSFGCTRKMYNYYVDSLYKQLEQQNYTDGFIKNIKYETPANIKAEFDYMKEIDALALCNAQLDFKDAISKFNKKSDKKTYTKRARKREKTLGIKPTFRDLKGMPKFKSKKKNDFSYTTNNQSRGGKWKDIKLDNNYLSIPKVKTPIKIIIHRDLPQDCIIKNVTISIDSKGIFYASLCIEYVKDIEPKKSESILGLDYSQHDFYVSSDGEIANYPHYYRVMEEKLKLEQRKLSRKVLKSNNWIKQKKKISILQNKIANQRKDWLHKQSYRLAEAYDVVVVEDIDLRAIAQCLSLGKNLHDNGFGMFRVFLEYKLKERGKQFIKIDRWYPSSKTCSVCGYIKKDLELRDRKWECPQCHTKHNRDYNASINIKEVGLTLLAW
jgi:putative transposase